MHKALKKTLIRGLAKTAKAGLGAAAAGATPKRRRKRVKKGEECTPCQAYGAVDEAFARVRDGSL